MLHSYPSGHVRKGLGNNFARKCLEQWNAAVGVDEGKNTALANQPGTFYHMHDFKGRKTLITHEWTKPGTHASSSTSVFKTTSAITTPI